MSISEQKNKLQQQLDTHLESPIPILSKLKRWILGKDNPDTYTQISFYIGFAVWVISSTWLILGYAVISNTTWIELEKGVDIQTIINELGQKYGFDDSLFLDRLVNFYRLALFSWFTVLLGLILQWRKKTVFVYFIVGGALLYLIGMWSMLSFAYWKHEITTFDKLCFFVLLGHSLLYFYFLYREQKGDKLSFFGIDEDDDDTE